MIKTTVALSLLFASGLAVASGSSQNNDNVTVDTSVKTDSRVHVDGGNIKNSGNSAQYQGQTVDSSGNASTGDVTVEAGTHYDAQRRNPVSTAYAAPLTSSNDTCMGSTSIGGQGITFGISFGSTWTDEDCVMRKDARLIHNMQRSTVAMALMCQKETVLEAIRLAGTRADKVACGLEVESLEVESRNSLYGAGENG